MPDEEQDALEHLRLVLAHLRGEGSRVRDPRGLVPGGDVRGYSKLIGDAVRHCWAFAGAPLPEGRELGDYR